MAAIAQPRPAGVWLAACIAAAAIALGLLEMFDFMRRGMLLAGPLVALPALIALVLGVVGFWQMRWWGVLLAVATAICIDAVSLLGGVPKTLFVMAAYSLPMIVAAALCRRRFTW